MKPNISAKSNIWINCENPHDPRANTPQHARDYIPGDLMIDFLGTRDRRVLERELTPKQYEEYCAYRFFLYRGQQGRAFDER